MAPVAVKVVELPGQIFAEFGVTVKLKFGLMETTAVVEPVQVPVDPITV